MLLRRVKRNHLDVYVSRRVKSLISWLMEYWYIYLVITPLLHRVAYTYFLHTLVFFSCLYITIYLFIKRKYIIKYYLHCNFFNILNMMVWNCFMPIVNKIYFSSGSSSRGGIQLRFKTFCLHFTKKIPLCMFLKPYCFYYLKIMIFKL